MPKVIFNLPDGTQKTIDVEVGDSLLEAAHRNHIALEGACEGSLACSTCHVIIASEWYDKLAEPSEEEEDLLDLAFDLKRTSRLGCQIKMEEALDGIEITIPAKTRNVISGGHH